MLNTKLIHPEIMAYLAHCGHGSQILIADGNYPLAEKSGDAPLVYLGITPGVPTVTEVLEAIQDVIPIESYTVMQPDTNEKPPIFDEFEKMLPDLPVEKVGRYEFYDKCNKQGGLALAISTGEMRVFSNILITIGVRTA
jgi:L-fucose mutarotase